LPRSYFGVKSFDAKVSEAPPGLPVSSLFMILWNFGPPWGENPTESRFSTGAPVGLGAAMGVSGAGAEKLVEFLHDPGVSG
jgi:hypothetical protein